MSELPTTQPVNPSESVQSEAKSGKTSEQIAAQINRIGEKLAKRATKLELSRSSVMLQANEPYEERDFSFSRRSDGTESASLRSFRTNRTLMQEALSSAAFARSQDGTEVRKEITTTRYNPGRVSDEGAIITAGMDGSLSGSYKNEINNYKPTELSTEQISTVAAQSLSRIRGAIAEVELNAAGNPHTPRPLDDQLLGEFIKK